MNTPENTTTKIDGRAENPEFDGPLAGPDASRMTPEDSQPETPEQTVAKLQAQINQQKDQTLRDRADLENTRKRLQKEKEDAVRYANTRLLENLLPILDNFELGMMEARRGSENSPVLIGMSMVQKQIENFVSENGLQPIEAVGQKFDPNLHEALGEEPSVEVPEGNVLRVQRKGYKLKDRLLRPASVFVSKGKG